MNDSNDLINDFLRSVADEFSSNHPQSNQTYGTFLNPLFSMLRTTPQRRNSVLSARGQGIPNKINCDLIDCQDKIFIYAELPGVQKDSINIEFDGDKIIITADKNNEPVDNITLKILSEIKYGFYERVLTLPFNVSKRESVNCQYSKGILAIKIDKLITDNKSFSVKPIFEEEKSQTTEESKKE